jgi:hypothetical protein
MHAGELLDRRGRRLFSQQVGKPLPLQRPQDGAQPIGAFGVPLARVVVQAGGMRDQDDGQGAVPPGWALARRRPN